MRSMRKGPLRLSIIIPTKNEEKNLPWVLIRIKRLSHKLPEHEIIVVDGHSTDKTREVAKKFGCRVILDHMKGKGEAMRTAAKRANGKILLFIDADGSHNPKDIPKLITPIVKDEVDLVLVEDRVPIAIEVKSRLQRAEIPQGLKQFLRQYPECKTAIVLNEDLKQEVKFEGRRVVFAPHYYASLIPFLYRRNWE